LSTLRHKRASLAHIGPSDLLSEGDPSITITVHVINAKIINAKEGYSHSCPNNTLVPPNFFRKATFRQCNRSIV
jgi:hypothetical protein